MVSMRATRQVEAAEVHKVCTQSPVSVPTGTSSPLQICQGSRRTQTTLATLQHCKVVKVSLSSISFGGNSQDCDEHEASAGACWNYGHIYYHRPRPRNPTHQQTRGMSPHPQPPSNACPNRLLSTMGLSLQLRGTYILIPASVQWI